MTKYGVEATNEQIEQLLKELQAIKANEISSQKIDENQLENITGGTDCGYNYRWNLSVGDHLGKCNEVYLTTECDATVEAGSCCWSHDMCTIFSETYHCVSNRHGYM